MMKGMGGMTGPKSAPTNMTQRQAMMAFVGVVASVDHNRPGRSGWAR